MYDLAMFRTNPVEQNKPMILISHSLGGIIVKDALCQSRTEMNKSLKNVLCSTHGVIFLACPHRGSNIASLGKLAFEISRLVIQNPNLKVLRGIEVNSEILERITKNFGQILDSTDLQLHSFEEELTTKGTMIVDTFSSTIGHPRETRGTLPANHRDIAKVSSMNDIKYQRVISIIERWRSLWEAKIQHFYCTILQSLDFPEARMRINTVEKAYNETYNWLFDPNVGFASWLEGKQANPRFWIQGKPGSGKSTAMKFAMGHERTRMLLQDYDRNEWVIAGFFFHDPGSDSQKSTLGFLREILYQILSQREDCLEIPQFLNTPVQKHRMLDPTGGFLKQRLDNYWDVGTLQEALLSIAQRPISNINLCLFVDGLDEHNGNHKDLLLVLNRLAQLTENGCFRSRLCLASRAENVFKDALQSCPGLLMHMNTTKDVQIYAQDRIRKERGITLTEVGEGELSTLTDKIIEAAQGVFMWVRLVVDELMERLMDGESLEEINTVFSAIPTELGDLYERSLRRPYLAGRPALPKYKREAYIMFRIAAGFGGSLSLTDFIGATLFLTMGSSAAGIVETLSSDQMERRLYARSTGLLETVWIPSRGEEIVQFIHQTVKDFVTDGKGHWIIIENIPNTLQRSSCELMLHYMTYVNLFAQSAWHRVSRQHQLSFRSYSRNLEYGENRCFREFLEPLILSLDAQVRSNFIEVLLLEIFERLDWEHLVMGQLHRPKFQLLQCYILSNFLLSATEALASLKDDMDELDVCAVAECTMISTRRSSASDEEIQSINSRLMRMKDAQDRKDSSPGWFIALYQEMHREDWFCNDDTDCLAINKVTQKYYAQLRSELSSFAERASSSIRASES